jgi:hypothetical protein
LLIERRGDAPPTILRPSIMTASREHPFPGWIDSTSGLGAFVISPGTATLRARLRSAREARSDRRWTK